MKNVMRSLILIGILSLMVMGCNGDPDNGKEEEGRVVEAKYRGTFSINTPTAVGRITLTEKSGTYKFGTMDEFTNSSWTVDNFLYNRTSSGNEIIRGIFEDVDTWLQTTPDGEPWDVELKFKRE